MTIHINQRFAIMDETHAGENYCQDEASNIVTHMNILKHKIWV